MTTLKTTEYAGPDSALHFQVRLIEADWEFNSRTGLYFRRGIALNKEAALEYFLEHGELPAGVA